MHVRGCLGDLEQESGSLGDKERFVARLNDFLLSARAALEYLGKEAGRNPLLKHWVEREKQHLVTVNPRFAFFLQLRNASAKDCLVEPSTQLTEIAAGDEVKVTEGHGLEILDADGKVVGRAMHFGPPDTKASTVRISSIRAIYHLSDWPQEDIVMFCAGVLSTLTDLVSRAYQQFP